MGVAMPVGVAQSQGSSQRLHAGNTPVVTSPQWRIALCGELVCDGIERPTRARQVLDAGTQAGIVRALRIAGDGTYEPTFRLPTPCPGDTYAHLFTRALHVHL